MSEPTLAATLVSVWEQALRDGAETVELEGRTSAVGRTRSQGLRTVAFRYGELQLEGIEQNPNRTSRWAELARQGRRIMQYRHRGRYIGNVCDGALNRYGAWSSLGLPP